MAARLWALTSCAAPPRYVHPADLAGHRELCAQPALQDHIGSLKSDRRTDLTVLNLQSTLPSHNVMQMRQTYGSLFAVMGVRHRATSGFRVKALLGLPGRGSPHYRRHTANAF
jgi:hypothetical protein